uniref:Uncharacterized protein n=1 Tax=Chenopodium quinoa TaxID=63459 RepID=A0A803L1J7_CHEQI
MVQQLLSSSSSNFSIGAQFQNHGPTSLPYLSLSSHNSIITNTAQFKLPRNWVSHVSSSKLSLSVKCRQSSEYFDKSPPRFSPSYSPNPSTTSSGFPPKVFVGHSIYKGKAALTVEPKAPEFVPLDSGAFKVSREGYVLLQFAPAAGVRQYDWSRKQTSSLALDLLGSEHPLQYIQGVQNKLLNLDENVYIPISKAEFAVLVTAFNFVLPYLLGWNVFADNIKPDDSNRINSSNTRTGDYEWNR